MFLSTPYASHLVSQSRSSEGLGMFLEPLKWINQKEMKKIICALFVFGFVLTNEAMAQMQVNLLELTHVGCAGLQNGAIHIEAVGGTEPYSYSWSHNDQNAPFIGNLNGGFYFLTVTDAGGNSVNKSYIINEPTTLLAYFIQATIDEGGCNAKAELIIEGGSTPYKHDGEAISSNTDLTGLCPGVKTMTIRDNAGCVSTASLRIATIE